MASTRGRQVQPSTTPLLYRPAEVAKRLSCSEWWVKEQARNRRIPFSWIGGSYRFTEEHIAEIVRLFEQRPAIDALGGDGAHSRPMVTHQPPRTRLQARTPRRMRSQRAIDAA